MTSLAVRPTSTHERSRWERARDAVARAAKSRRVRLAVKLSLTPIAFGVALLTLRGTPFHAVFAGLAAFPHVLLPIALACGLVQVVALAARLWLVFPRDRRPRFRDVARAYAYGGVMNAFLPGRAGDVMKVVALGKHDEHAAKETSGQAGRRTLGAVAALVADRALDLVAFVTFGLVLCRGLLAGAVVGAAHAAAWPLGIGVGVVVLAALLLRRFRPATFAKLGAGIGAMRTAARGQLDAKRAAGGIALGLAGWGAELAMMAILGGGLGIHLALAQVAAGLVVLNLGIAVPVSVANVGTYEAATVVGLAAFGVPPAQAIALGALHHLLQIACAVLAALGFWVRDRAVAFAAARRRRAVVLRVPLRLPAARVAELA